MKKTLLFSNVVGNIMLDSKEENCVFNEYMNSYLKENIIENSTLVFINAPGLGSEENYLPNIINCFENIFISFDSILSIDYNSEFDKEMLNQYKNVVYFLMGGNPITQLEIIRYFNLESDIKNYDGLVIGFCAGAINLSKHSIITTDNDFKEPLNYDGIGRVNLCVEPHYNLSDITSLRTNELLAFSKKYNTEIIAVPDESIIIVEGDIVIEKGNIQHIKA